LKNSVGPALHSSQLYALQHSAPSVFNDPHRTVRHLSYEAVSSDPKRRELAPDAGLDAAPFERAILARVVVFQQRRRLSLLCRAGQAQGGMSGKGNRLCFANRQTFHEDQRSTSARGRHELAAAANVVRRRANESLLGPKYVRLQSQVNLMKHKSERLRRQSSKFLLPNKRSINKIL